MGAGEFFGAARMQVRSEHFTVSAVTHSNPRRVPKHAHTNAFVCMLIGGHYRESFGDHHWEARPLSMVLRPAQVEHVDEIGPRGAVFLCVDMAPGYWEALASAGARLQRRAFQDRPMSWAGLRLLRELCGKHAGWHAMAESLIDELVMEYVIESRHIVGCKPRWLPRVLERLHGDPSRQSLAAIAADLDLHPVHVSRMFKQHLGVTVSQYQREMRLQRAVRALLEGDESLVEVAQAHGFADQSHMTREFSRVTNWSPAKLRCECERLSGD